jgi:hypothetical protein
MWLRPIRTMLPVVLVLMIGGCADYDPPIQGDHTSDKYRADLEKCRTSSTETVRLKNAATPQSRVISPITGPPEVHALIRKCMVGKGYVLEKTDD